MADEPPSISEQFWIECDERHDPYPVMLITCRTCGVHHVIDPDESLTIAGVIDIAQGHRCSGG